MGRRRFIDPLLQPVVTTPARNFDTIYQNTTGRPILVQLYLSLLRGGDNQRAFVTIFCDPTTPPTTAVAGGGLGRDGAAETYEFINETVTFVVPRGYYYEAETTEDVGSSVVMGGWLEVEL